MRFIYGRFFTSFFLTLFRVPFHAKFATLHVLFIHDPIYFFTDFSYVRFLVLIYIYIDIQLLYGCAKRMLLLFDGNFVAFYVV